MRICDRPILAQRNWLLLSTAGALKSCGPVWRWPRREAIASRLREIAGTHRAKCLGGAILKVAMPGTLHLSRSLHRGGELDVSRSSLARYILDTAGGRRRNWGLSYGTDPVLGSGWMVGNPSVKSINGRFARDSGATSGKPRIADCGQRDKNDENN